MKRIKLTQGKFALVDGEDYDWLMTWKWYAHNHGHTFYAVARSGEFKISMHRLLMLYPRATYVVDHIDHNGLNNQKSNIRVVTQRGNLWNLKRGGTSRYKGVCWDKRSRKWLAQIVISNRKKGLGYFKVEEDAAYAYLRAIKKLGDSLMGLISDHSKTSPSGSSRWMACPGCIRASEGMDNKSSVYASEGTAAHTLGELTLLNKPIPKTIRADDIEYSVTDEMKEHVQVYVDAVLERNPHSNYMVVEQRFRLNNLCKNIYGTSDCAILNKKKGILSVIDLKFGRGVVVEPKGNTQMMIYALGMMTHFVNGHMLTWAEAENYVVELIIAQPRAYHEDGPVRVHVMAGRELIHWGDTVLAPAVKATEDPAAPLHAGKHCRFCPALAICPEQMNMAIELAQTDFANPIMPEPSSLSGIDLAKVMHMADIIGAWKEKVMVYAKEQMEAGFKIPGYKLVAKRSIRQWKDEKAAEKKLKRILKEDAYEKKLLSIAKAEKVLKAEGKDPEKVLDGLWVKPDAGATIARDSDKRKEIQATAISDFDIFS
jgi:hypothetical protein